MTELADLYGDDETPDPEPDDTTREAMRLLVRRWARAKAQLEATSEPYHRAIRELAARQEWATAPLAQRVLYLQEQIANCARARLHEDPRIKSWKLPDGTVSSRTTQPEILIENEPDFIAWARDAAPELLVNVPKIDKRSAKSALSILPDGATVVSRHGEVVPGVQVKPLTTSFSFAVATGDDLEAF